VNVSQGAMLETAFSMMLGWTAIAECSV